MDALPDRARGSLAEYERIADQVRAMCDGIDEVRATAYSDGELVTAVVGGRGQLLELVLDSRVFRDQDATGLAVMIMATVRDAAEQAEQEATRLAEKLVPARDRGAGFDPVFDPALHLLDSETRPRSGHG
jgi:DNA-binding protein YbaB